MNGRTSLMPAARAVACGIAAMLVVSASLLLGSSARAADDDARQLLKAMSDYMAAQNAISFNYQSSVEGVTKDFQKLQFVSSGTVTVDRPDKIRVTRTGGFADIELVFDGTTLSVLGKNLQAYAQVDAKGTLDDLDEYLANAGVEPPGHDLLAANVYDALMDGVTDAKHVASAVVGGVECEYLTFRTPDVDWAIWIRSGDRPVPLRYVITSKHVVQAPQYTLEISDWKDGSEVASADFGFKPPADAKKVDFSELEMVDELPSPTEGDVQ